MTVPPIISGLGKATNFKFDRYIQRVRPNKSRLKIWEKMERGRINGLPKFLEYSILSQDWVKVRTSNLAGTFIGSIRTNAIKNLGEKRAWAFPGAAEFFSIPPIISGTGKATNFKFCYSQYRLEQKPITNFGKIIAVGRGVVRTLEIFQGTRTCIFGRIARSSLRQLSFVAIACRPYVVCPSVCL